jgi:hypothetical protein
MGGFEMERHSSGGIHELKMTFREEGYSQGIR